MSYSPRESIAGGYGGLKGFLARLFGIGGISGLEHSFRADFKGEVYKVSQTHVETSSQTSIRNRTMVSKNWA